MVTVFRIQTAMFLVCAAGVGSFADAEDGVPRSRAVLESSIDSIENRIVADSSLARVKPEDPTKPMRPIAQTIIGSILTAGGAVSLAAGVVFFALANAAERTGEDGGVVAVLFGAIYTAAGLGEGIPGVITLSIARNKWKKYNVWEKSRTTVAGQGIDIRYTLDF
ncbi:MAG: hypothetical protein JW913_19000 [Chitinispirillaceae bacterium]|nr:hypothetical protein [Chitinispirillaceae bacterium]